MEQFIDAVLLRANATEIFSNKHLSVLKEILQQIADNYEITTKENALISYDYLQPEAYQAFLVIKKAEGLSDKTIKQYKYIIDHFLLSMMKPLEDITTTDIQLYLYKKSHTDNNQVTSVNNIRRILSTFFTWLFNSHWIPNNPMFNIKPIKGLKKTYDPITPEQFEQIMGSLIHPRDKALIATLAGSGIRNGEACSMLLEDLDLENKRFKVIGKGNKERICFLTPRAKYELKKYLATRNDNTPYVFVSKRQPYKNISTHCIDALFQKLSNKVGYTVYPHKLRHYFADNAHTAGIDVLDISHMMGHESINTTKIYMSSNVEDLAYKHTKLK